MSARLPYKVESLRQQIDAKMADAIRDAQKRCNEDANIVARVDAWREQAEQRLLTMAEKIRTKDYQDAELSGFSIKDMPTNDRYGRSPETVRDNAVQRAEEFHTRSLARLDALVAQADGTLWLTTTMLSDLFGL